MDERDALSPDELRHEIERLRVENRRLQSLLGLDVLEPATAQLPPPTPAWEPRGNRMNVTGRGPAGAVASAPSSATPDSPQDDGIHGLPHP